MKRVKALCCLAFLFLIELGVSLKTSNIRGDVINSPLEEAPQRFKIFKVSLKKFEHTVEHRQQLFDFLHKSQSYVTDENIEQLLLTDEDVTPAAKEVPVVLL